MVYQNYDAIPITVAITATVNDVIRNVSDKYGFTLGNVKAYFHWNCI